MKRCTSEQFGYRCAHVAGHGGWHCSEARGDSAVAYFTCWTDVVRTRADVETPAGPVVPLSTMTTLSQGQRFELTVRMSER